MQDSGMARKNAFYAQSGGVTAVINASACGLLECARMNKDRIGKVFAGRNGIIGALREDPVSYTHLRAHETVLDIVCRLLLEKKN